MSPLELDRAKSLMVELKQQGMSNPEVVELTSGRWNESTVKGYTKGVRATDLIDSLKSRVADGTLIPVIEFLRANTKFEWPSVYSPAPALTESQRELSTSSEWKPSDFLPALPPHPPLPRGLFKD